ncbi:MAG TPA: hypothetical protein PLJ35_20150 [Anaerolineae bacterium]|jgi:hypothetical protein|nr:hypothetical protein [Anaerolineae bacterium]
MVTKLSLLQDAARAGDWRQALRIASRFPRLGSDRAVILAAWEAVARPDFQRQLGREPEALIEAGIAALKSRFSL